MKGMPPKLVSDDGRHVVIRPLAYVAEADLARWAAHRAFPIIPCNLCGSQANLQRVQVGQMLRDWEREHPGRIDRIFRAMAHVDASHLMDKQLFPFTSLQADGTPDANGDRAFDEDDLDACSAIDGAAVPLDRIGVALAPRPAPDQSADAAPARSRSSRS
jgi:tRNA 2-thiocytidine biosynthesis protein TtcA